MNDELEKTAQAAFEASKVGQEVAGSTMFAIQEVWKDGWKAAYTPQPMETAPKDRYVDAYRALAKEHCEVYWSSDGCWKLVNPACEGEDEVWPDCWFERRPCPSLEEIQAALQARDDQ